MRKSLILLSFAVVIGTAVLVLNGPAVSQSAGSFLSLQAANPGTAQPGNTNITGVQRNRQTLSTTTASEHAVYGIRGASAGGIGGLFPAGVIGDSDVGNGVIANASAANADGIFAIGSGAARSAGEFLGNGTSADGIRSSSSNGLAAQFGLAGGNTVVWNKLGIGTAPVFPIDFNDVVGDKISLWGNTPTSHYGFGIQTNLLQIFCDGSSSSIAFGRGGSGSFTEFMRITGTGLVGIGTTAPASALDVNGYVTWRDTVSALGILRSHGSHGGAISLLEENGTSDTVRIEPDVQGSGGFITVLGGAGNIFEIDGNFVGTGSPKVNIIGASAIVLDSSTTGNSSAQLPNGSISSDEIQDEPGVAHDVFSTSIALTSTFQTVSSKSITAPADGFVIVWGSMLTLHSHVSGTSTQVWSGVSTSPTTVESDDECLFQVASAAPTGSYNSTASPVSVFPVTAGVHTFYLNAREGAGSSSAFDTHLVCLFVPTAYGAVERPGGSGNGRNSPGIPNGYKTGELEMDESMMRGGLTDKEINQERQREVQRHLKKLEDDQRRVLEQIKKLRASSGNK